MRIVLLVFLFLLTYDGALRKWVLPGGELVLFLLKDALFLAALGYVAVAGLHRSRNIAVPSSVQHLFWLYALWVMLEALNPSLPNVLVGLWGAKAHLLYAGIILLLPLLFLNLRHAFRTFEKMYPLLVIPVTSLALLQVTLPGDHFINQQVRGGIEGIAFFGDASLVRVAGPFSYITGMSAFVQFSVLLGAGLCVAGSRSWLFLGGLAFALAALPVTGSRGVVTTVSAGAAVMLVAGVAARTISARLLLRALLVFGVLLFVSLATQDAAWEALHQRTEANREEGWPRVITAFTNAFDYFDVAGVVGFGAGGANLGAIALAPSEVPFSWLPVGMNFEEESGRIVLELGIFGWSLSLLMRIAILCWAIHLVFQGATSESRAAAVLALPFTALAVHQGNGVFAASYMAVAYWFCAALLAMAEYEHRSARVLRARHVSGQSMAAGLPGRL